MKEILIGLALAAVLITLLLLGWQGYKKAQSSSYAGDEVVGARILRRIRARLGLSRLTVQDLADELKLPAGQVRSSLHWLYTNDYLAHNDAVLGWNKADITRKGHGWIDPN